MHSRENLKIFKKGHDFIVKNVQIENICDGVKLPKYAQNTLLKTSNLKSGKMKKAKI